MNKIELLKEWFYKEEERKGALNDSLNIPIGILTGILAGIYFLVSKYNYCSGSKILKIIFIILIVASILYWLASIIYLLLSYNNLYKGYKYKSFPNARFIQKEYQTLKPYYKKYKKDLKKNITLDKLVEDNIEEILIQCIDNNVFNNDRKSAYLHSSKIQILNCILLLFISSVMFSINYINNEKEEIYNIKITNYMSDKKTPPPPPRPQEPRIIKESQQPTRHVPPNKPTQQPKK
jgi:hypothetical protein